MSIVRLVIPHGDGHISCHSLDHKFSSEVTEIESHTYLFLPNRVQILTFPKSSVRLGTMIKSL